MRRLLVLALLLALGAVSTVAVAWACAAWVPMSGDKFVGYTREAQGVVMQSNGWGVTRIWSLTQPAPDAAALPAWAEHDRSDDVSSRTFLACGWPLLAVESHVDHQLVCERLENRSQFVEVQFGGDVQLRRGSEHQLSRHGRTLDGCMELIDVDAAGGERA